MSNLVDVLILGGGPAGLAVAGGLVSPLESYIPPFGMSQIPKLP